MKKKKCFHIDGEFNYFVLKTATKSDYMITLSVGVSFNPSLAEHDMPHLSKQWRSRSVGF